MGSLLKTRNREYAATSGSVHGTRSARDVLQVILTAHLGYSPLVGFCLRFPLQMPTLVGMVYASISQYVQETVSAGAPPAVPSRKIK